MRHRNRRITVSVIAWVLCAVSSILMFGLIDLGTTLGLSDPRYRWPMSLEASWGSVFTFLIGGGFAWIGARPVQPGPGLGLLWIAALSLIAGSAALGDPRPLYVAFPLLALVLLFAKSLGVRATRRKKARKLGSFPHSFIAATGVVLWLGYACLTLMLAWNANPEAGDVTNGIDHWPVQIALGVAIAIGAALLFLYPDLWGVLVLWRWMFGLSALAVAWAGLAYPDRAGAMPHALSELLILGWGASVVLVRSAPNRPAKGQSPLFVQRAAGED